jgi:hypothetical protein
MTTSFAANRWVKGPREGVAKKVRGFEAAEA